MRLSVPLFFFLFLSLTPIALRCQSLQLDAAMEKRWHIREAINNNNTPLLAKNIYQNQPWQITTDADAYRLLHNLDSLTAISVNNRGFYFVVAAMTFDKAYGTYLDGLSQTAKDYVDNNLTEFLNYFTGEGKLPPIYLQKWAAIVANQVESLKENQDPKILDKLFKTYDQKCKACSSEQKEVLKQFENLVKTYVK